MELNRREQLERLVMGMEMAIEQTKALLPFYKPDDLELVYAKKYLAATEEHLARTKKDLEELLKTEAPNDRR
jgi:hypothetical protein